MSTALQLQFFTVQAVSYSPIMSNKVQTPPPQYNKWKALTRRSRHEVRRPPSLPRILSHGCDVFSLVWSFTQHPSNGTLFDAFDMPENANLVHEV